MRHCSLSILITQMKLEEPLAANCDVQFDPIKNILEVKIQKTKVQHDF